MKNSHIVAASGHRQKNFSQFGLFYCLAVLIFFIFPGPETPQIQDTDFQPTREMAMHFVSHSPGCSSLGSVELTVGNLRVFDWEVIQSVIRYTKETNSIPNLHLLTLDDSPSIFPISYNGKESVWIWSPSLLPSIPFYEEETLHLRIFAASPSYLMLTVFYSQTKVCRCGDEGCGKVILELEEGVEFVQERSMSLSVGGMEGVIYVTVCMAPQSRGASPFVMGLSAFYPI